MGSGPGFNPDLYVRCGAIPTPSSYLAAATSSDSYEFLSVSVQSPSGCASPSSIYVAVHSKAGQGQFDLVASPASIAVNVEAAVEGPTPSELTAVQSALGRMAHQIYAATEGQIWIPHINIRVQPDGTMFNDFDNCNSKCASVPCLCFVREWDFLLHANGIDHGLAIISHGHLPSDPLGYWIQDDRLAHELSHALLGQDDEYNKANGAGNCSECGHSIMAYEFQPGNNFCIGGTHANHGLDKDCGIPPGTPGWLRSSLLTQYDDNTPDTFDYVVHDFNGYPTFSIF